MIVLCEEPVWTETELTDVMGDLLMRPIDLLTGRYDTKFQSVDRDTIVIQQVVQNIEAARG